MACAHALAVCISMWLTAHGYSTAQRDAVLSYMHRESDFNPSLIERTGACLWQHAGHRRHQILALGGGRCPPWEQQMEFGDHELRTEFRRFWTADNPHAYMRNCFGMGRCR